MPHNDASDSEGPTPSDSASWKAARMSGRFSPPKVTNFLGLGGLGLALGAALIGWETYHQFLVDVPKEHVAVLVKKEGIDLDNTDEIAPDEEHRGVQRAVLTEGRYFRNPF